MRVAKDSYMNPVTISLHHPLSHRTPSDFWERILNDDQLRGCDDLEKLLAGCEIIAALDHVELLAA